MPGHPLPHSETLSPAARRALELLELSPLPGEGGYFRETYRSGESIPANVLPGRYATRERGRSYSTQIYFLLTPASPSLMHLVQSDEVFHHYSGDPVEQLHLDSSGATRIVLIGSNLEVGERPQVVVPRGVWQGCRLQAAQADGAAVGYSLLGCTVSPGFDWGDFRLGSRQEMLLLAPGISGRERELLMALTPESGGAN